jgi:predicted HAD superfamily Cof-like phosphohydrolase
MTIQTGFQNVEEFHRVFQQPVKRCPDITVFDEDPKLVALRLSLIEEETREFLEALENKDVVEMVDALADINYVVYGGGLAFGINMDSMLKLSKRPQTSKDIEPSKFFSETSPQDISQLVSAFAILLNELKAAFESRNMIDIAVVFVRFIEHTYAAAAMMNVDLDEAFRLVHESNMTKACLDEDQALLSLEQYKKDMTVYKDPAVKRSDNGKYWIIFDRATGKTLKSKFYRAVDLKPLVFGN